LPFKKHKKTSQKRDILYRVKPLRLQALLYQNKSPMQGGAKRVPNASKAHGHGLYRA